MRKRSFRLVARQALIDLSIFLLIAEHITSEVKQKLLLHNAVSFLLFVGLSFASLGTANFRYLAVLRNDGTVRELIRKLKMPFYAFLLPECAKNKRRCFFIFASLCSPNDHITGLKAVFQGFFLALAETNPRGF